MLLPLVPVAAQPLSVRNIVIGMSEADVDSALTAAGYRKTARTQGSPVITTWTSTGPMVESDRIDIAFGPDAKVQLVRRVAQMANARQPSTRATWRQALAQTHGKPALLGQAVEDVSDFLFFRGPGSAPDCNGFPIAASGADWSLSSDLPFTGSGQACRAGLGIHLMFAPGGHRRMTAAVWILWSVPQAAASGRAQSAIAASDPEEGPQVWWESKFLSDVKMIGLATDEWQNFISMTVACAGPNRLSIAMEAGSGGAAGSPSRTLPLVVNGTRFALPAGFFRSESDDTDWLDAEVGIDAPVAAALRQARSLENAALGARGALPIDGFTLAFQSLEEQCRGTLPRGYVLLESGEYDRCMDTAMNTVAMIDCSVREVARLEPALASAHAAAAPKGKAPKSLARLREERIATCEAAAQAYAGGSMMGIERGTCLVGEMRSQLAHLRRAAEPVPAASQPVPVAASASNGFTPAFLNGVVARQHSQRSALRNTFLNPNSPVQSAASCCAASARAGSQTSAIPSCRAMITTRPRLTCG
ncbi:MAG: hypothetical protein KKC79_16710 [Gammaproteobacteria bacterium]|nr:hypothetical protein [Gammaproteobacteria bacterium]